MNKAELLEAIKELQDDDSVDNLFNTAREQNLSLEDVKKFMENSAEGRKYLDSYADVRVTNGIETYRKKHLQEEVSKELAKYDITGKKKTEEQLKIEELERKINEAEAEAKKAKRVNALKDKLNASSISSDLLDFFYAENEEEVDKRINKFNEYVDKLADERVQARVKSSTYKAPSNANLNTDKNDKDTILKQILNI